jgi:RND family efflux transporter MFP subunit
MKVWHAGVVALAVVAAGCGGGKAELREPAPEAVHARVAAAQKVNLPARLELYGTVEANRVAAVSSRVMATVTAVKVQAGDSVKRGQVLVEIDPDTARAQEAQARGALAQAQAALQLSQRNLERFKALHEKNAASQLELDMAQMHFEQAQGAVNQAQGAVDAAASVAKESTVVSPFDGHVVAKMAEVGDLAAPGRPLMTVESATGRRLALAVPESVAGSIKVGQTMDVTIDSMPQLGTVAGRVEEKTPGADPASHTFVVKVGLEGAEVPSGVAGRAGVTTGTREAVAVPRDAVVSHGGVELVVVRDADGKARSRAVTVGEGLDGGRVEILSGLDGDETVLVGLSQAPADGAPVEEVQS